jgi:hypothetical protein
MESLTLKAGVCFAQTRSGAVLLDLSADRFIALGPLSAVIWSGVAARKHVRDLLDDMRHFTGLAAPEAEVLLRDQITRWIHAGLIDCKEADPLLLPENRATSAPASAELGQAGLLQTRPSLTIAARLLAVESRYRRSLRRLGLARTLVLLQSERGAQSGDTDTFIATTVRSYYALRRPFRQGRTARDCLLRSITLAAVLRRAGLLAELCIGIVHVPFAAHAWVEHEGIVLNEGIRRCGKYTMVGRF